MSSDQFCFTLFASSSTKTKVKRVRWQNIIRLEELRKPTDIPKRKSSAVNRQVALQFPLRAMSQHTSQSFGADIDVVNEVNSARTTRRTPRIFGVRFSSTTSGKRQQRSSRSAISTGHETILCVTRSRRIPTVRASSDRARIVNGIVTRAGVVKGLAWLTQHAAARTRCVIQQIAINSRSASSEPS